MRMKENEKLVKTAPLYQTKSEIRAAACLLRSRNWRHLENSDVSEQKLFAVPGETAGK